MGKSGGGGGSRPKSVAPSYPRPTSIARTAATGGMPPGWEAAIDESSGETYYYHGETGKTRWEFPMADDGWEIATDPASGDSYWYNMHTNETAWERPAAKQTFEGATSSPGRNSKEVD